MNLLEISWPVFRLSEHKPIVDGELVYYSKEYVDNDSEQVQVGLRLVDDKGIPGQTLGARRLRIMQSDSVKLFPVRRAIYYLGDLIKTAKPTTWFIDNAGKPFQYKKSTRARLVCHKIRKVLPSGGMGAIVELEGISTRYKALYSPTSEQQYAGVLQWGLSYVLYGFYTEPFKPSYRSV